MSVVSLALLPPEILDQILSSMDPLDVASFSQTCRAYFNLVHRPKDNHLWRMLYLEQPFDDPRHSLTPRLYRIPPGSIDWKGSLQAIIRARTVLADMSKCRPGERETILRTLVKMLRSAPPAPSFGEKALSKNVVWLVAMLRDGFFLTDGLSRSTATELQLRAYLLVHLGLTPSDSVSANKASARAFVYDIRNYRYDSNFGPYMSDGSGRINWVHVYAIHRTIAMHLVDLREDESFVFPLIPISMPYCQSIIPGGLDLDKTRDWAGIEGLWHCTFSFVDHRDLLQINNLLVGTTANPPSPLRSLTWQTQPGSDPGPLDTTVFRDPEFREEFRVLPVHFRVIGTEHDPYHVARPRLMFAGEVRDGQTMVGRVEMTPDEHLRWKWVCGENGQSVWSCDAIQVGGVRSPYGVLGSWTTVFHDPHDPVGPLWMHKVYD